MAVSIFEAKEIFRNIRKEEEKQKKDKSKLQKKNDTTIWDSLERMHSKLMYRSYLMFLYFFRT